MCVVCCPERVSCSTQRGCSSCASVRVLAFSAICCKPHFDIFELVLLFGARPKLEHGCVCQREAARKDRDFISNRL